MAHNSVFLIALVALIVWRVVLTGLLHRRPARRITTRNQLRRGFSGRHLRTGPVGAAIPDNHFGNATNAVHAIKREDRAKAYLRRIVALTGARQMGNSYVLDVGTTRFNVRDRYVGRLRETADPKCAYAETCYYSAHREMPKAEQIATALLQLNSNPALFDKWITQSGLLFKADGTTVQPHPAIRWCSECE